MPFSKVLLIVRKPLGNKYIKHPRTLGEKIRNRRIELELLQKDLAAIMGISMDSITNWENNYVDPDIKFYPKIISFLGYYPFKHGRTIPALIVKYRFQNGLSQKQFGKMIGVDGSTVGSWEKGEHLPSPTKISKMKALIFSPSSKQIET